MKHITKHKKVDNDMDEKETRIDRDYIKHLLKKRLPNMHKGDFGHVLIIAGQAGMTGAAALAAKSALRSGSGLVYVCTPKENFKVLQILVPEAIVVTWESVLEKLENKVEVPGAHFAEYDAIAIGPGMGVGNETKEMFEKVLDLYTGPLIVDADGLNLLAGDDALREKFFGYPGEKVITPHQGEAARLLAGARLGAGERVDVATGLAIGYNAIAVLKGHETLVAKRGEDGIDILRNTTGDPGMATAGSGDVLTGMITSFSGQGMKLWAAAAAGVYLHGSAGDMAAEEKGEYGMIAGDIVQYVPYAIKEFV